MKKNNWDKYKKRIESAFYYVYGYRDAVIHKRVNKGMNIVRAVEKTDKEAEKILRDVGALQLTPMGYQRIITKYDWERFERPPIKKVHNVPLFKKWKRMIKNGMEKDRWKKENN